MSLSDFTAASCSIDESINLANNSNDDNDNHNKWCQTENNVLAERSCQTDLDMAQLDIQQIYIQHITDLDMAQLLTYSRSTFNISLMSAAVQKDNCYRLS